MRQLLLLRHAKSSREGDGTAAAQGGDHGRCLDASGQVAARAMGATLRTLNLAPDLVLVSSSRRTMQTLEALEPWDETPLIEVMDGLYLAPAPHILAVLNGVAETVRSVMVIGHNPGMHDLAIVLGDAHATTKGTPLPSCLAAGFPTAALAEFTIAAHWSDLAPCGGRLVRFVVPKDLPGERLELAR